MSDNGRLTESVNNMKYQAEKISFLSDCLVRAISEVVTDFAENELNPSYLKDTIKVFKSRVYADSLLNSLSSMIDYYYMDMAIRMGSKLENVRSIQYKKVQNNRISKKGGWLRFLKDNESLFNEKFANRDQMWDLHYYLWSEVYRADLVSLGVMETTTPPYEETVDEKTGKTVIEPDKLIAEYFYRTSFLHCDRTGNGHSSNIFLELNNFLKHNRSPILEYEVQKVRANGKASLVALPFFKVKESEYCFLGEGVVSYFAKISCKELKSNLDFRSKRNGELCDIEKEWGPVISLDTENNYECNGRLFFNVDHVLISKAEDSISINVISLMHVSRRILREMERILDVVLISKK
ncbi:hypothetical protein [Serratia fonticola]|uniref:Uncharacterized protein n=1 Tax=Serratia fonticola TaxID=47917 RepID=A0AAE7JU05_SERFO|nr:hypothetical protein [Serratia fonticola]QKJ59369.2 hypothetical protein G9399_14800 [Serratia fonticola]